MSRQLRHICCDTERCRTYRRPSQHEGVPSGVSVFFRLNMFFQVNSGNHQCHSVSCLCTLFFWIQELQTLFTCDRDGLRRTACMLSAAQPCMGLPFVGPLSGTGAARWHHMICQAYRLCLMFASVWFDRILTVMYWSYRCNNE